MLTSAISSSNQPAARTRNNLGEKDIFLKLLVAQMQNQNPLKPQDATQMSSQLAQFNMVDAQRQTNEKLNTLVALQAIRTNEGTASSYLGHEVAYGGDIVSHTGGSTNMMIQLGQDSASTEILIKDDTGTVIRHISAGALGKGDNFVTWDGLDDKGNTMPNGDYTLEIKATDKAGDAMAAASISPMGIVSAIRTNAQGLSLIINGKEIQLDSVGYIRA